MDNELLYYLAFSHFLGIGPSRLAGLMRKFGTARNSYLAGRRELAEVIGLSWAEKFVNFRSGFDPVRKLEQLKAKGIKVFANFDESYPADLKNISDPPICLYVKGEPSVLGNSEGAPMRFAIVGTRRPTQYGLQLAEYFSRNLVEAGFSIVSGLAFGIDTSAHKACLEAGGKTIAVLGCGVDIVYPADNRPLYEKIINMGCVMSEFPPGQLVAKGLFIARNRIISALSKGVLIVEGTSDSGSLITARYAAEQGKEVFAPPGPITSNMSAAPNHLLKQGAKLATSVADILEEYSLKVTPKTRRIEYEKMDPGEREVIRILDKSARSIDELAIDIGKTANETLNLISLLEMKDVIEKNGENKFQIKL